jgi:uncharacterized protein
VTALRAEVRGFRPLTSSDFGALLRLVDRDPYVNAVVAARLEAVGALLPGRLGGELLGVEEVDGPGALVGACFCGGNLLPIGDRRDTAEALGNYLVARRRPSTSLIGRAEILDLLWPVMASHWGPPRLVRPNQPLLVIDRPARVAADPAVRPARIGELDSYLPAATAMFEEELRIGSFEGAARLSYRARLGELIGAQRAFVRIDRRGRVAFKAEIGAVSHATCQVQGVWVRPDLRGRGLAAAGMSAVIDHGLRLAPSVSLYVNDFNLAARTVYERLGMGQVGTLSTVMF